MERTTDVARVARMGQTLFAAFSTVQLLLVAALSPLLVATGVLEEKEERTLEMVVISRLTAAHILWGKVGSRLLSLLSLVVGGLPMLAMVVSLGGVGPWEVVNLTSTTLLVAVVLGLVAGFVALFSRGPLVPVAAALLFAAVVGPWTLVPVGILAPWITRSGAQLAGGPVALVGWLSWLPVLLQLGALGAPVLRIVTTDDSEEEFGLMSPEFWVLERFRRRTRLAWVGVFGGGLALALLGAVVRQVSPRPWLTPAWTVWGVVLLFAVSSSYLLVTLWGVQTWQVRVRARERARAQRAELRGTSRRVWNNPVLWREVRRALPAPVVAASFLALLASAEALWALLIREAHGVVSALVLGLCLVATPLVAAAPTIEQRRRRTLPLLLLTPLSLRAIVLGKTVGPLVRVAGPAAASAMTLLMLTGQPSRVPWAAWWYLTLMLLLASAAVAAASWVRPLSLAWPVIVGGTLAWLLGPPLAAAIADAGGLRGSSLIHLWFPLATMSRLGAHQVGDGALLLAKIGLAHLCGAGLAALLTGLALARQRR
jgi:ABC-type transport system involved in multi-copper enzyme maturation permease subunit